jgi:hypothetical protein
MPNPKGMIAPTGRKLSINCVQVGRYESDLAMKVRLCYDQADVREKLGLSPAPTAAASA